ncbi:hypothetical protein GQ54DRAFT_297065 [Martensiomyces pterosporus]|nr:hypothetical protein GQ54DRAFT_297065 [Martensiomyces pterosporus]
MAAAVLICAASVCLGSSVAKRKYRKTLAKRGGLVSWFSFWQIALRDTKLHAQQQASAMQPLQAVYSSQRPCVLGI